MADEKTSHPYEGLPQRGIAQPIEQGDEAGARHSPAGAPTDAAHQDDGDGTLTGSVPAGLSSDELKDRANTARPDDAGSE